MVFKKVFGRVTWVAQLVKHLTLDFGSSHDLTVCGIQPPGGLHTDSREPDAGLKLMNHEIMTWAKIKSQMLNQLSHPGALSSQFLRVSYGLPPSLTFFFPSPPPWVPVKFLRIHIRVKPYGICLSLPDLFHLASHSPVPSTLVQKAIFHSFSLPCSIPLCI